MRRRTRQASTSKYCGNIIIQQRPTFSPQNRRSKQIVVVLWTQPHIFSNTAQWRQRVLLFSNTVSTSVVLGKNEIWLCNFRWLGWDRKSRQPVPSLLACHSLTLLRKSVTDINENSVVQRARLQTFWPFSEIEADVLTFRVICSAGLKLHKGKGKGNDTRFPSHAIKACVQRKRRYRLTLRRH